MAAVFIPVAFMSGPVGVFYRQFSVTMATAIILSGIVALTLTPALCAMMLKIITDNLKKLHLRIDLLMLSTKIQFSTRKIPKSIR